MCLECGVIVSSPVLNCWDGNYSHAAFNMWTQSSTEKNNLEDSRKTAKRTYFLNIS